LTSRRLAALVALLLLATAMPGAAADRVFRYSGKVERIDLDEGLVIVDELAARGQRRRHELRVGPETPILTAARLRPWEMRGASAFQEVAVSLLDLLAGDFVVVESMEEDGRLVAVRITIVESQRPAVRP
jgi:hypothetical protein